MMNQQKDQGKPDIGLNKGQVTGIKVPNEIAVEREHKSGHEGTHPVDIECSDKGIHKESAQQAVHDGRINIGSLR